MYEKAEALRNLIKQETNPRIADDLALQFEDVLHSIADAESKPVQFWLRRRLFHASMTDWLPQELLFIWHEYKKLKGRKVNAAA